MTSIRHLLAITVFALSAASCSKSVPSDGFKDLKYGMSLEQLRAFGFNCEPDDIMCSQPAGSDRHPYTLFGKEARVYLETRAGKLVSIDVNIDATTDELIELFSRELGKPKSFTYASLGGQAQKTYWISGSRAAIVITPSGTSLFGTPRAGAEYLGPEETSDFLQEISSNSIRGDDY